MRREIKERAGFNGARVTRPDYFSPYASNGLGVVPRRGWDERTAHFLTEAAENPCHGVRMWAELAPLRLLDVITTTHPLSSMAMSNDISLAFAPGDTRIVAVENAQDRENNPEGTAVLDALWDSLPGEVGGLLGLQHTLGEMATTLGMGCVEGIVGPRGGGLVDIATFSPLSVRFRDDDRGRRLLEQSQGTRWETMPPETVLAIAYRGSRDNPYGRPRFGAFLSEGLADIAEQQSLKDVLRAVAWPHLAFEFPINETVKFAQENPEVCQGMAEDGGDLTPLQYAQLVYAAFMQLLPTLKADDSMALPSGARANVLNGGAGLSGAVDAMTFRRLRICQSLDHLPSLLGITDGGTQAYASTQWKQYAAKIESLRAWVNGILVRIANLHLRLLGLKLIARADTQPIQTSDRKSDAEAAAREFENAKNQYVWGIASDADFAQSVSSSGVVDPAKLEAAYQREIATPAPKTPAGVGTGTETGTGRNGDNAS